VAQHRSRSVRQGYGVWHGTAAERRCTTISLQYTARTGCDTPIAKGDAVQPVPCSTGLKGLIRQPRSGVVQPFPYRTAPQGLIARFPAPQAGNAPKRRGLKFPCVYPGLRCSTPKFDFFRPYGGGSFAVFRRQLLGAPYPVAPSLPFPSQGPPATGAALRLYPMPRADAEANRGNQRAPLCVSTRAGSQVPFARSVSCRSAV
jgi:hypothetical protein